MFKDTFSRGAEFTRLSQSEDCESLVSDSSTSEKSVPQKRTLLVRDAGALILVASLLSGLIGLALGSLFLNANSSKTLIERISNYSPLLPDVDISFKPVQFNGSFFQETIFRQPASPEVDAAWESLGVDYRPVIVPTELGEKSGLGPNKVQVAEKYGGGFPANVEGLHHLHCLNLLRKSLYHNYDYYHALGKGAFSNDDRVIRSHVTHCLDILRQQLMCTVDVGVLGQVWWNKESPTAFTDFNTKHMCRNFEDVRKWAEAHQAPKDVSEDYLKPPRSWDDVAESIP